VAWWDPGALTLGLKPTFGVRRDDLIVKDVPRHVVGDGRGRYDRWKLARHEACAAGGVPSLVVETVREWSAVEDRVVLPPLAVDPGDVTIVDVLDARGGERPGGTGFGLLVHGVVAQASFDASAQERLELARVEARVLGMSDADAIEAASVVERLFAHDLLVRARAADARGACRRETSITCTLRDGLVVEGVVDMAFEEQGVWTVVDYKTDREMAAVGEDRYRRQVALYASAITQATGQPARGVLVRV
jgi:hypothetical protein